MIKITNENREANQAKFARWLEEDPDFPRLRKRKYWIEIEVTDESDASCLLAMIYDPKMIEGHELLGFHLCQIAHGGVGSIQDIKKRLIEFANTL